MVADTRTRGHGPQLLPPSLLPAPSAGSPLANPVRVALYYPRNVTDALTLRYTLDGSAVTNASLIFTNDTQLGTSSRSNFLAAWHFSSCRACVRVCMCGSSCVANDHDSCAGVSSTGSRSVASAL
jgi:hypothetical protein